MEILVALALTAIIVFQNLHIRKLTTHNTDLTLELSNNQLKNCAASTPNPNMKTVEEATADWNARMAKIMDGIK